MSIVQRTLEKMNQDKKLHPPREEAGFAAPVATRPPEAAMPDTDLPHRIITVDREALCREGILADEAHRSVCAAQFRIIKQDLLRHVRAAPAASLPARFIMIGSALPGDGKSFTSMNLAISLAAEKDSDVLLIDGDVSKRHLTGALGMGKEPGLLEVLRDPACKFSSVMYATNVPRLHIMPAGEWSEDASELLASERMRELSLDIFSRYPKRIMLIDASPILLTPEARSIAGLVGQIVVVVSAGVTLQSNVKRAVELVQGSDRRTTLVLNRLAHSRVLDAFYGYGYGYGYGREYEHGHRTKGHREAGSHAET